MKTKLIELLNKLIEKGWSPFGYHEWKYWYNEIEYFNNELTLSFGEWAWKFIKTTKNPLERKAFAGFFYFFLKY